MAKRFSIEAIFTAVDKISAPVTRMQNRINKMTRSTSAGLKKLDRNLSKVSGGLKKVALAATVGLAATSAALADVISTGASFEQNLVNAAAKFPGEIQKGTEAFRMLEQAAREVGRTTEFTATQSAEALNFLAMAGFNAESSVAALPGVVDLATVAQVDLATATDIATDSLGAFNLLTKDSVQLGKNLARTNDLIAATATSSNTSIEQMFEAIKEGAPVATTAGASMETFLALTGELANAGIKGSRAGTTLKNMFLKLSAPSDQAARLLRRFNVATQDSQGNLRDMTDILGDLDKSLAGLGTAQKTAVLEEIFGKIPIAGVNVLLASGADKIKEYRKQLEGADGASKKMAATMRNTLSGRFKEFKSSVESVKLSIFALAEGPINDVVKSMTTWVRANEKFLSQKIGSVVKAIFENPGRILKWAKAIGIVVAVIGTLIIIVKSLIAVLTLVNLVMAANPVVLIALAIVALIAIVVAAVIWFEEWTTWLGNTSTAFKILVAAIALLFAPLVLLVGLIVWLIKNFDELQEAFVIVFTSMFITIDKWTNLAVDLVVGAWTGVKNFFTSLWADIVLGAKIAFNEIADIADTVAMEADAISFAAGLIDEDDLDDSAERRGLAASSRSGEISRLRREQAARQTVSPQAAVSREIQESRTTSATEVTIRDETGRAEITKGASAPGLQLMQSGGF